MNRSSSHRNKTLKVLMQYKWVYICMYVCMYNIISTIQKKSIISPESLKHCSNILQKHFKNTRKYYLLKSCQKYKNSPKILQKLFKIYTAKTQNYKFQAYPYYHWLTHTLSYIYIHNTLMHTYIIHTYKLNYRNFKLIDI